MKYETVIGLEVHIQLNTKTKAFCGCSTEFGKPANTQVCPVCLGFPGTLPVLNRVALDHAIKVGIAINCQVQEYTKFDRKHYFYPDLPKNYQISQYDFPVCKNGYVDILVDGKTKRINILRAHLEEDAGKLIHKENYSVVDYNRTGIPLLEIVSQPEMNSPAQAYDYLTRLKSIIEYLDVSDCDMEKGSLRCDANISLRKAGDPKLGVKTELKNMNSFKAVKEAMEYEVRRQSEALDDGESIMQETRLWNEKEGKTYSMRTKEEAKDYRYFPEPDLPPFMISPAKIEEIKKTIPELPEEKSKRFIEGYALNEYEAAIIVSSRKDADYFEECCALYADKNKKIIANWFIGPLLSEANNRKCRIAELKIKPSGLIDLFELINKQTISNLSAKTVLTEMIDSGKEPKSIISEKNLAQVSDAASLEAHITEVINENQKSVEDFKSGKANALMFLVGQVMKKSKGKANPKVVTDMLKGRLI